MTTITTIALLHHLCLCALLGALLRGRAGRLQCSQCGGKRAAAAAASSSVRTSETQTTVIIVYASIAVFVEAAATAAAAADATARSTIQLLVEDGHDGGSPLLRG